MLYHLSLPQHSPILLLFGITKIVAAMLMTYYRGIEICNTTESHELSATMKNMTYFETFAFPVKYLDNGTNMYPQLIAIQYLNGQVSFNFVMSYILLLFIVCFLITIRDTQSLLTITFILYHGTPTVCLFYFCNFLKITTESGLNSKQVIAIAIPIGMSFFCNFKTNG